MASRDAEWRQFSALCSELRGVKSSKGVSVAIDKLQSFLNDDHSRHLVHRWRSWGYLLTCLLHVIKEEMRSCLCRGTRSKSKATARSKIPQLRYWHYLRTELETAHVTADGPVLHVDPNGRDCIRELITFSVAVIDRPTPLAFDRNFETLVDKEAWLTVEVLVQYRVYCAVLNDKDWKHITAIAIDSISPNCNVRRLVGDVATATTRARVIRLLLKNCSFDLIPVLPRVTLEIETWFEAVKGENSTDLLLVIASTLMETLTDLMQTNFGSIAPFMLKRGVTVLEFICKSNRERKNGLKGAPAEFVMQFLKLYQHNVTAEPDMCYLPPKQLLCAMKKLAHVAMSLEEINHVMTHFNSAKERRLGNALGIDDQEIRRLACTADIIFHHDQLVSDQMQSSTGKLTPDDSLFGQFDVGSKRPRFAPTELAWEVVIEHVIDSPRIDIPYITASSASPASQRQSASVAYLSRDFRAPQSRRTDTQQTNDSSSWLLLLLSILRRHGDYYMSNRVGDLMMVMRKLGDMLVVKEMGKWQSLTLHILIQMASLSARFHNECSNHLSEHWSTVWRNLLRPDLPYARATEGIGLNRGQAGDAVLTLVNCCVLLGLVSIDTIEASSTDLWNLPAFHQPALDTHVSRGDIMRPYARTSMASVCALVTLLRHVQLPAGSDTTLAMSHAHGLLTTDDDVLSASHVSVPSRLLRSVFDHLRAQIFRRNIASSKVNAGSSSTKVDWQTEVSPTVYASVIRSFFGHATSKTDTPEEYVFTPELLRKFSANSEIECKSWMTTEELNGFGVAFCMLENGLEYLSMAFPLSTGVKPSGFSPPIQAIVGKIAEMDESSWYEGVGLCERKGDYFERLAVPANLLGKLIPRQNVFFSNDFCTKDSHACAQSVSTKRVQVLQKEVINSFSELLAEISTSLPSDESSPIEGLRVLANSLDVGIVLAALYADEYVNRSAKSQESCMRVLPLLQQFIEMVANYMKPSVIKRAQQSHSMSENIVHILRRLHTLILISQGRNTLERCRHPSADPIELRTPPDLRPAIRAIVSSLEASLASLSGLSANAPGQTMLPTDSSSIRGLSRWISSSSQPPQSQPLGQLIQKEWDAMDNGEEDDVSHDRPASRVLQKSANLWCFRLILLLRKDSGLSSVKTFCEGLQFDPDFLLAVAVLVCGVAGHDSLEVFVKLIDYAAEKGMCENRTLPTTRDTSCRASIFLSQVLSALVLAGLVYEKRKYEHDESPPTLLMACAKKHLETMAGLGSRSNLRMARRAELQCLEVFFRLSTREFSEFEESCVTGLTDCDVSVRVIASRGLQSIYYMYPAGGESIFRHFFNALKTVLDDPAVTSCANVEDETKAQHQPTGQEVADPRLSMDWCLSVLLCLYVSACSSEMALPAVLKVCVAMASMTASIYAAGTPSLISSWLNAVAVFYGYADVSDMVDNHFCCLWHEFITSHQLVHDDDNTNLAWLKSDVAAPLPNGKYLLQQFPVQSLLGEAVDLSTTRLILSKQLDMILSIGVLHSFRFGKGQGVEENRFDFVGELASYFFSKINNSEKENDNAALEIAEQLTTDLFAFSFILLAYPDPMLNELTNQMLEAAKERAQASPLSSSHLGHIVSKMARFIVWGIFEGNDNEQYAQSELWKSAVKAMKEKYFNFDWKLINLAEVISEFYVLLLRTELFYPRAVCAVECFKIFVVEVVDAMAENPVLQRLLLVVCFQAIKHLAVRNRRRIGSTLSLLVRELCERFMKKADMFGKYLGFVVQEISDILSNCIAIPRKALNAMSLDAKSQKLLSLNADDQADLEWVIFAVCNDLSSSLGKYALDMDMVPNGISESLDKLNALVIGSRMMMSSKACRGEEILRPNSPPHCNVDRHNQAKQHIHMFIQREHVRGATFYNPLPFDKLSSASTIENNSYTQETAHASIESFADVRLSALTTSIANVRDFSPSTRKLCGKLANTLLYLSSSGSFDSNDIYQDRDMLSLANALGELGALDTSDYELSTAEQEEELSRLYRLYFHRGALRETKTTFSLTMHESVLAYLSSIVFERKKAGRFASSVLEQTLTTLKNVLNLDDGIRALARCKDGELKSFLSPFEGSSPSSWSSAFPNNSEDWSQQPKTTLRYCAELWISAEKIGFEAWVCSLTSFLTRKSPDQVLKACSILASLRVDMAVFLFPYALESILRKSEHQKKPDDKANAAESNDTEDFSGITKAINDGISFVLTGAQSYKSSTQIDVLEDQICSLNTNRSQPPQVIQLVIHSINFLRETEKARFVESNGRVPRRSSGPKQTPPKTTYGNELAYGCMVDVKDFLAVAKAAVHVKMPYSAMQYVEMWLEKEHGGKITSLSSLNNDEVANALRGILVDAYGFDSDDDGIYGVNDGRTLQSQLVKYNREGQHVKALPLYDVSLQFKNSTVVDSGETNNGNPLRLVEGMLSSLQSLGYNNLLEGYLQSMQWNGRSMDLESRSSSLQALQHKYNLAWKNMQWEAVLPGLTTSDEMWKYDNKEALLASSFLHQKVIFEGLRAIAHRNFTHLQNVMSKAKKQVLRSIQLSLQSLESSKDSYSAMVYLQAIREIEEMANHIRKSNRVADRDMFSKATWTGSKRFSSSLDDTVVDPRALPTAKHLLERWQQRRNQIKNDFDKAESLLALEEVLLQVSKASDDKQGLIKLYLDLASLSRKAGRTAVAYRALHKLDQLDHSGLLRVHERMQSKVQKCKLLWKQQEFRSAIWTGKEVCSELSTYLHGSSLSADEATSLQLLLVQVLTLTGKWVASQRSESSQTIREEYFQKATEIMTSVDTDKVSERAQDAAKPHFALAEFMAAMYQQVSIRVTSREWLVGKKVMQARHEELRELQTMEQSMQNENRGHIHALNKEVVHDMNERTKVEASVDQFLIGALRSYGKGLCLSSQAELDMVFRLFSLWFNNQGKADINRVVIEDIIDVVPSFNFVPLSYQIVSRISSSTENTSTFQTALRKLVMKLSMEHPHHTLIQLVALKNSGDVEGKGALQFRANVGDAKAKAAKVYLAELMKTELRELLESLDSMANAYVQLALFDTSEYHGQKKKIFLSKVPVVETNSGRSGATPFDQCLRFRAQRGYTVTKPAVLTAYIPPQADMDYSNVVRMYSFEPQFCITDSGIHRPKIIYCYGSDGERYKQLVKGQDDTRQDLVIEQVFETMNQFLLEEKESRKRKLRLRTYRVVPLSPIAGVLEWVENTIPWGSYLVSRTSKRLSAHERYHPFEWKHTECRQYLKNAPEKLPAFLEIQANFTPVFHHYFLEKFPDAAIWYHRRLAYVQSTAVTSIVGYILGIGDRHSQNILIHEETGELVHIDFGVVFDQGMALYTPETVPFRLTRDMVDGMGISGVDGVFSRCCEVTLQLLRKKSASVVTILEVFVHDPLYRWTLSPLKALRIQEGGENDAIKSAARSRRVSRLSSNTITGPASPNDTQPAEGIQAEPGSTDAAARALIRVKQKLEGYEDANGSALSIEGQVKQLLSAAQDPHNLCRLFPGWAPWL